MWRNILTDQTAENTHQKSDIHFLPSPRIILSPHYIYASPIGPRASRNSTCAALQFPLLSFLLRTYFLTSAPASKCVQPTTSLSRRRVPDRGTDVGADVSYLIFPCAQLWSSPHISPISSLWLLQFCTACCFKSRSLITTKRRALSLLFQLGIDGCYLPHTRQQAV